MDTDQFADIRERGKVYVDKTDIVSDVFVLELKVDGTVDDAGRKFRQVLKLSLPPLKSSNTLSR